MSANPSLGLRLILFLAGAQLLTFALIGVFIMPLYAYFDLDNAGITFDDWAEERAHQLVLNSLAGGRGSVSLKPSQEMLAYAKKFPAFRAAAFQFADMAPLQGSSSELVSLMQEIKRLRLRGTVFSLKTSDGMEPRCSARPQNFNEERLVTAVCGYGFSWEEAPYILRDYARSFFLSSNSLFYLPLVVASLLIAALIVRRALAPLDKVADQARRIDLDSLAQRLPESEVPGEIMPLVHAMNGALARLDAGVARQRRFTANAAHELRTPIAILRARIDNPENKTLREDLRRNLRRMRTIVEQLLVVARFNEHGVLFDENLDLTRALLPIVADYMPVVIENGRFIEFEAGDSIWVRMNLRALESIVANLLDNALKAEPPGGTIVVRAARGGVIEVVDHGEGIAIEDREAVFEPFWRKKEAVPGTGLGLAIVKELVEHYRGTSSVHDTPGGGATFRIVLPELERGAAANPAAA
jgi:signal transduction histidine kinase